MTNKIRKFFSNEWLGLVLLAATWLIFFSRTLIGRSVYFLDDLKIIFYPLEHSYLQAQQAWQLPLWSNLFGFGHPLIAWGQLGFFTPLHLFLRLFSLHPLTLLQISILAYFAFGLLGMYVFLRHHRLPSLSASLGSLIFVFSGFHIGHLNHINFYTTTMLLPWLLLSYDALSKRPTLRRVSILSLLAAAMASSGQPQIVLYSFSIAVIYSFFHWRRLFSKSKIPGDTSKLKQLLTAPNYLLIFYISIATILAIALSSFSIFPLIEFMPSTDRADGLSTVELLDFSYPPHHAITLILPYFFGDHSNYWGAKGFQELAAYLGIIPILLTGVALSHWRRQKTLRLFSIFLVIGGAIFALGSNSPVYSYLVNNYLLTSLSVPGRFVFFCITGIAILSSLGLSDILSNHHKSRRHRLAATLSGLATLFIVTAPFFRLIAHQPNFIPRLYELLSANQPYPYLLALGIIVWLVIVWLPPNLRSARLVQIMLPLLASTTLIIYGWNYNPTTPRHVAFDESVISSYLELYSSLTGIPARLYTPPPLRIYSQMRTDPISPHFTVHQPITVQQDNLSCLRLPTDRTRDVSGLVRVSIRNSLDQPPLREIELNTDQILSSTPTLCFDPIGTTNQQFYISFSSDHNSGLRLVTEPTDNPDNQVLFVRVQQPTPDQLARSRKSARIIVDQLHPETSDTELATLARHTNVTANASSANWIGALSIKPFRDLASYFFANDLDPAEAVNINPVSEKRAIIDLFGTTHILVEAPPDTDYSLPTTGLTQIKTYNVGSRKFNFYANHDAWPKAFLVRNAIFLPPDDETRVAINQPDFDPTQVVYIDGPAPPASLPPYSTEPLLSSVNITNYTPTRIDVDVSTDSPAFLVLTDSTTPQWHTYIDNQSAQQFSAYTTFKAAQIPPGQHTVSFRYESPAIELSKKLTTGSLLIIILLLTLPFKLVLKQFNKNK